MASWQIVLALTLLVVLGGVLVILNAARAQKGLRIFGVGAAALVIVAAVALGCWAVAASWETPNVQAARSYLAGPAPVKQPLPPTVLSPTPPAPPAKEPVPPWQGELMKRKWHERGDMLKKKWAERNKK